MHLSIKKSVCLFFIHLESVHASASTLGVDSPFIKEKVEGYFSPEMIGIHRPPCFQPMWLQYSLV